MISFTENIPSVSGNVRSNNTMSKLFSSKTFFAGARDVVKPVEERAENQKSSAFCAQNPAHGLNSTFGRESFTFTVRAGEGADAPAQALRKPRLS